MHVLNNELCASKNSCIACTFIMIVSNKTCICIILMHGSLGIKLTSFS